MDLRVLGETRVCGQVLLTGEFYGWFVLVADDLGRCGISYHVYIGDRASAQAWSQVVGLTPM